MPPRHGRSRSAGSRVRSTSRSPRTATAGGAGSPRRAASASMPRWRRRWRRVAAGSRAGRIPADDAGRAATVRRTASVRITIDGEPLERRVLFVAIANGAYYGGGMRIAPGCARRRRAARPLHRRRHLAPHGPPAAAQPLPRDPRAAPGRVHRARQARDRPARPRPRSTSTASRSVPAAGGRASGRGRSGGREPRPGSARLEAAGVATRSASAPLLGARGRRIGTVDAVFADYLLVRTASLLPVDLYVPRTDDGPRGRPAAGHRRPATRPTSAGTGR